jgi:hypothetical protein
VQGAFKRRDILKFKKSQPPDGGCTETISISSAPAIGPTVDFFDFGDERVTTRAVALEGTISAFCATCNAGFKFGGPSAEFFSFSRIGMAVSDTLGPKNIAGGRLRGEFLSKLDMDSRAPVAGGRMPTRSCHRSYSARSNRNRILRMPLAIRSGTTCREEAANAGWNPLRPECVLSMASWRSLGSIAMAVTSAAPV